MAKDRVRVCSMPGCAVHSRSVDHCVHSVERFPHSPTGYNGRRTERDSSACFVKGPRDVLGGDPSAHPRRYVSGDGSPAGVLVQDAVDFTRRARSASWRSGCHPAPSGGLSTFYQRDPPYNPPPSARYDDQSSDGPCKPLKAKFLYPSRAGERFTKAMHNQGRDIPPPADYPARKTTENCHRCVGTGSTLHGVRSMGKGAYHWKSTWAFSPGMRILMLRFSIGSLPSSLVDMEAQVEAYFYDETASDLDDE
ncbi:hypothetical protein M427DRAFT_35695 [Gonapodya prolifera JEL478]|uniref:Uncharacterized protein n=1 Tax=Gonapodya prolifera (strain JEL478) TaxID=1344416 RepID=A0A139A4I0_GONPJ|nr:hypothetical protein M427DRAFT_35695 [Gonapodya prolifera JEL478]|eukprot:KXS11579.1 hypothetical protein M427DRAFT_35695 [Gonapodya prolifera JEL478]